MLLMTTIYNLTQTNNSMYIYLNRLQLRDQKELSHTNLNNNGNNSTTNSIDDDNSDNYNNNSIDDNS